MDLVHGGSDFVVAVIENLAKEVGVAAFDLQKNKLHLSQVYLLTTTFTLAYQNHHIYKVFCACEHHARIVANDDS